MSKNYRFGFTLAEVMIVLAIIGVVAALVLPSFMQDMAERINSHRQANIAQKITKSVELMIVNGDYQGIYNTEQFVNKLSKYLKIAKRCDNAHLSDCWPTSKIKTAKGEEYNVEDAKTSKDLHTRGGQTDNVGLILADGATLIMTFNPDVSAPSAEGGFIPSKKSLPVGKGKTEEFAYTSNATNAIDFVMDVNGKTGPNQESDGESYYDIRSFKIATFSTGTCAGGFKIGNLCILELGSNYKPLNCANQEEQQYCYTTNPVHFSGMTINYQAGANKACQEIGMRLPKSSEFNLFNNSGKFQLDLSKGYISSSYYYNCNPGPACWTYYTSNGSKYLSEYSPVFCVGE